MHNFKSHFQWDFLTYCTRTVSVHLAMACVGCSFDKFFSSLFAQFKTTTKSHENYVSCIHFQVWPYPPKIMKKLYFILVNCMGWQVWINDGPFSSSVKCFLFRSSDWWSDILPWLCACTKYLKLNTSELPRPKPQLMIAMHCLPAWPSLDFGLSRTVHTEGSSMVMPNIDSIFVAILLYLWGWWHKWSWCHISRQSRRQHT